MVEEEFTLFIQFFFFFFIKCMDNFLSWVCSHKAHAALFSGIKVSAQVVAQVHGAGSLGCDQRCWHSGDTVVK